MASPGAGKRGASMTRSMLKLPRTVIMRTSDQSGTDLLWPLPTTNQKEHGHAHRQAVGHLLQNYRARAVRDITVNFNPAINRSGMHDQHIRFGLLKARAVQSKEAR